MSPSVEAGNSPRLGRYVVKALEQESFRAFVPPPLPPDPPVRIDSLQLLLEQANQALGRLDGLASLLPDLSLFIYTYVRKEAVLSSQIEGTQSSLSDLLLFENNEAPGVPLHDVQEVSNYVAAMTHGLERMRGGFPLSLRLIREIHEILLAKGRGSDKQPGEFRRSQNWIGGSRPGNAVFVPPPPELVMECMGALELFLHEQRPDIPLLIRAGLVHVQFETIHPFLDGNGRTGRLVLNLILIRLGYPPAVIRKPERGRYLNALRRADGGDPGPLAEMLARAVTDTLTRFIVPAIAGPARLVPLAALASKDVSSRALRAAAERGRLRAQRDEHGHWRSTRNWVRDYCESRYRRDA